ncbi:MAG: ParB/RepB/Spo0J family partition protein [Gammaproteobacteria bacterium]|nr:ParB/RepB/Spo0J family partition protein [Gammaproteobacteria bacterium]
MSKRRGLGKGLGDMGLSELLGDIQTEVKATETALSPVVDIAPQEQLIEQQAPGSRLQKLGVDLLQPGRYQPRKNFSQESLQELADSIKAQGIIQPLVARPMRDNQYEIIAGERRWRAAQLAGLSDVPVIVRDIPDEAAIAMSLIENIQRRDLNAIEEANALNRLIIEFQMTHQEVAEAVGKSRTVVTNLLRLQKLNPDVRVLVEKGELDMGHARALLALEGTEQSGIAEMIVKKSLSVRQTEQLIRKLNQTKPGTPARTVTDPDILSLQQRLSEKLGAEVNIQHSAKGKGKLVINYHSVDELDGILESLSLAD